MLPVIYSMSVSLDGFIAGPGGEIGWSAPFPEQMRFHLEQTRHIAAYLCGSGLYQEMLVWENAEETMAGEVELEFARVWRAIPKVVFSRTLETVTGNARLATADLATEIRRLRDQFDAGVIAVGGAGLAATAIDENLIDEYRQFVCPIILGEGTPYFPPLAAPVDLRLLESQTLNSRTVYLRYERTR